MPSTVVTGFVGTARVFQDMVKNQSLLLAAAVLTIYIVLGILYESAVHPLTILAGLPSAAFGAVAALASMRYGIERHGPDWDLDVVWNRQEERHHDDRRGDRPPSCRGRISPGDPGGVPYAVPPDPDHQSRRAGWGHSDSNRPWRRRGPAPAIGRHSGRRPARITGADPLHHARPLSLSGATVWNSDVAAFGSGRANLPPHSRSAVCQRTVSAPPAPEGLLQHPILRRSDPRIRMPRSGRSQPIGRSSPEQASLMASRSRAYSGTPPPQRPISRPTSCRVRRPQRSYRASSTTCRLGSEDSPRASPPKPPAGPAA